MHNYQGHPGVAFIAGRTFQSEYGMHEAGTIVPEAPKFPNLDVLVSAGLLYPYSPDNGYEYLPPHLFRDTNLRSEIDAWLQGDTTSIKVEQFPNSEKPEVVLQAEREAEVQEQLIENINKAVAGRLQPEPRVPVKKAAAKKTSAPAQKTAETKEK